MVSGNGSYAMDNIPMCEMRGFLIEMQLCMEWTVFTAFTILQVRVSPELAGTPAVRFLRTGRAHSSPAFVLGGGPGTGCWLSCSMAFPPRPSASKASHV